MVHSEAYRDFGQDLVGETWELGPTQAFRVVHYVYGTVCSREGASPAARILKLIQ
jgi:hypothetical protein